MKIGDMVKVTKCDACPKVVGKTGKINQTISEAESCLGQPSVEVKFGRGRPQLGRPSVFVVEDVELVVVNKVENKDVVTGE